MSQVRTATFLLVTAITAGCGGGDPKPQGQIFLWDNAGTSFARRAFAYVELDWLSCVDQNRPRSGSCDALRCIDFATTSIRATPAPDAGTVLVTGTKLPLEFDYLVGGYPYMLSGFPDGIFGGGETITVAGR